MTKKTAILIISFLRLLVVANAQDPKLVLPIGHSKMVNSANFSHDGKYIVSASLDGTVKIWEVASGKLIHTLKGANIDTYGVGQHLSAIFTNDNKYVIATSIGNVYVWYVITEKLLYTIDNASWITNFCISSDQNNIITSGWDGTIKTWDFVNGKLLKTFGNKKEGEGRTSFVNFSSDQKYAITANLNDTVLRIWDMSSGNLLDSLKGLNKVDENFSAAISPDNNIIITTTHKNVPAQIWDASSRKLLYTKNYREFLTATNFGYPVMYPLFFSPDGKYILSSDFLYVLFPNGKPMGRKQLKNPVEVFNASTGELLFSLKEHEKTVLARISPDNKYVIISSADGTTKMWQISNGKLIYDIKEGHTAIVSSISFSNDGKYCVTSSRDGTIKVWSISNGKFVRTLIGDMNGSDDNLFSFNSKGQFSLDSKYIVSGIRNWEVATGISKWEVVTGKLLKIFEPEEGVLETLSSPQGKYVICLYENDTVRVRDVSAGKLLFTTNNLVYYKPFFSPDENHLITFPKDSIAKIWSLSSGKLINTLIIENWASAKFSPDSKSFITFSRSPNPNETQIKVWETSTGNLLKIIREDEQVSVYCFSPNGKDLFTSGNGISKIWDLRTGNLLLTFNRSGGIYEAEYSPDGKNVLIVHNGSVEVWNATTGHLISTLYEQYNKVEEVNYSPDGKYIITGSRDGVVKIWDVYGYKLLHTLNGINFSIEFSPDGNYISTISEEGIQRIWKLDSGTILYSLVINKNDCLVFDKDFRFDGTPAARDLLYYVCGNEVINIEQFKNLSWEPGLVSKIMGVNKEPITAKGLSEINICNFTPKVDEKGYGNGKYNFEITPRPGRIGEILLFVNNKQIKTYSPNQLIKNEGAYQLEVNEKEIKEYLVSGEDNNVEVVALTADKEMKSQRSVIEVKERLDKNAPVHLYAISVGISKYKDDKLKLTYASKDAEDFSAVLNKAAKKFLDIDSSQHVFTYTFSTSLASNWPSKENIKKAFEDVAKKATADDILVLFLAGHGTLKSMDKKFYFLTQEASSFGFAGVEKEVAISTDELNDWMSNIKAQKQILVLDACSSGEVVTDMQQLITKREIPADQLRALERLKDRTGTYILSASASGQAAYESSLYEQGLLTYSLLSGLKYGRGLKDNKFIDVTKWFNAAADEVKLLAKDIGGRQDPQIIGSASFDIGIIDKSISDSIKLTSKKKIFKSSTFIGNATLLSDELELSSLVDKELNELSARGIESPIVYVADNSTSDNYSLRGSYTVTNNQVRVNVTLFKGQKERLHQFEVKGKVAEKDKIVKEIVNRTRAWVEN